MDINPMFNEIFKPSAKSVLLHNAIEEIFHCKKCDKYLSEHEGDELCK